MVLSFCSVEVLHNFPHDFLSNQSVIGSKLFRFQAYGVFKNYSFVIESQIYHDGQAVVCAMWVSWNLLRLPLSLKFNIGFCECSKCS